jgi:hypothetical protein
MLIGEQAPSRALGARPAQARAPREDRPGQPVYVSTSRPSRAHGLPAATRADLDVLVPACARAHFEELGVDPLRRDPNGFRWRTRPRSRRALVALARGRRDPLQGGGIRVDAEAVQLQQVWVDPPCRRRLRERALAT